jgi:hypothetical protein
VAEAAGLEPEEISPAKFYPRMAAACHIYIMAQLFERNRSRGGLRRDCQNMVVVGG